MARNHTHDRARRSPTPAAAAPATDWLIAAALAVAVLALYGQTAGFEFVSLDDFEFVTQNAHVRGGLTSDAVAWSLTAVHPNWHPVTWWTHMLAVDLFGLSPGGHHAINTVFHAVNSALLFLALRVMTAATWPSALAAAVFAVHPLRVESVAWVTERKDVVSGFFWMLTMLGYTAYVRHPSVTRYLIVAVSLTLGMMSKTMLVSLPFILLLFDVWPFRRGSLFVASVPDRDRAAAPSARPWSWLLAEKIPLIVIAVGGSVLSVMTQRAVSATQSITDVPLSWRVMNAALAYTGYVRKTIWPSDLAAMYPHPALLGLPAEDFLWKTVVAALALVVTSALCLAQLAERPYLAVGWFWYVISLVPVIGLVQIGMQSMADRYTYLSMPGIYVALAWSLSDLVEARPRLRNRVVAACSVVLALFAVASWRQIATWRSSKTLYEHGLAVTENNYFMHASYGAVLRGEGNMVEAERHLREALRIRPDEAFTRMQLGTLLQETGRLDEAAEQHEAALRLDTDYVQARGNLGVVRLRQGRAVDAERELRAALAREPGYALAVTNLGAALLAQQRWAEAATVLRQAVALSPDAPDAHNNLGVALVRLGDLRGAEAEFLTTLRLRPGHANATRSLEYVRANLGR